MKILYFAWLRERINRGSEEVDPPAEVVTIADLIDWLAARDDAFAHAVDRRDLIRSARDARLVPHQTPIAGAHTIAFFPPMTGG